MKVAYTKNSSLKVGQARLLVDKGQADAVISFGDGRAVAILNESEFVQSVFEEARWNKNELGFMEKSFVGTVDQELQLLADHSGVDGLSSWEL